VSGLVFLQKEPVGVACIKPDGSLTEVGRKVLEGLREHGSREDAALSTGLPLYRVRLVCRALQEAGLVSEEQGRMQLTPTGEEKLVLVSADRP
jgi:hypothetical protein